MKRLLTIAVIGLLTACTNPTAHETGRPLALVVIPDGRGTWNDNIRVNLDKLVSIVESRGGILGLALIHDSDEPLIRLEVKPVVGRLDERAARKTGNRESIDKWKAQVAARQRKNRKGRMRDFARLVDRVNLFFAESTMPANAKKIVLLVGDERHTAHKRAVSFSRDVNLLAVGLRAVLVKDLAGQASLFESADSAIKAISNKER